jgi:DNA-binding IclR family transcriptional regulator
MTDVATDPFVENTRRSIDVINRDRQVARALTVAPAEGEDPKYTVEKLTEVLGLGRNAVYASMVNLKRRGFVEKEKTESRTPRWYLTELGTQYVGQLPAAA